MRPTIARAGFWIVGVAAAIAAWAILFALLQSNRDFALESAAQTRRGLARSLAEYQEASLRAIDLSLQSLRDAWQRTRGRFPEAVAEHEARLAAEKVSEVVVVDANARVRYSRRPPAGTVSVADRDYFRRHKASGRDEVVVSGPLSGRITGQRSIQISRPIFSPGGEFQGVIAVAVPVPALEAVYREVDLGRDGVVALVRDDGEVIAASGEFAGDAQGATHLFTVQRMRNYPLTIHVGQSRREVLAAHRRVRDWALGGASLATVLLVAAGLHLGRRRGERDRLRARVLAGEVELEAQRERTMLELHDGSIQSIYAVGMQLERARRSLDGNAEAAQAIAEAEARLALVIHELRRFLEEAPARAYPPSELADEVRWLASTHAPAVRAEVDIEPAAAAALDGERAAHVLRIVREAASNVGRHSGAGRMRVALRRRDGGLRLEVADDGAGIAGGRNGGLGLQHIRMRAQKLGGEARVESSAGGGTTITVDF